MTQAPEPPDLSAPKDPAEYRARPLLGPSFWALIALCVLCVLAGAAVAVLAPRFFPKPPAQPVAVAPPTDPAPVVGAPVSVTSDAAAATPLSPDADVEQLKTRIAALESHEKGATQAAAAALAAAALVEATQGPRPFTAELSAVRAAAPDFPELAALSRVAETGAPTRAALAASFPDYAARAAAASRRPGEGAGVMDRVSYVLSRIVTVRRVGETLGEGADAHLARAESYIEDGDLDRALRSLDQLSPAAREALAPWRARAERRAEIDRQAAALRARALHDLAAASRTGA